MGLGRSHSIAFLLYYNLSRIRDRITLVDPAYGLRYDGILEIGDPVFVAISFFRYARETMEITKFAREKKARIVEITDNPVSPVGQLADISSVRVTGVLPSSDLTRVPRLSLNVLLGDSP